MGGEGEEEEEGWMRWMFYVSLWRSVVGVARALLQTEQALLGWSAWDGWMDGMGWNTSNF
jgi:hypothetical protein